MAGRPPKPDSKRRNNVLRIRLTDADRKIIDRAAKQSGLDTSTWARRMLLELAGGCDQDSGSSDRRMV